MASTIAGWGTARSFLLEKNRFPSMVLQRCYRTRACPHPWLSSEFQGRSFAEVAISVKSSPADDKLVACGGTGLPEGILSIKRDGRFKADWLPVGGS